MNRLPALAVVLLCLLGSLPARAGDVHGAQELCELRRCIRGQIIDLTHNHGVDRRIWSASLCQRRDLYIYLPPGYDPQLQYPAMLWLHGFAQDEKSFLEHVVRPLDRAIVCGRLPPLIVAAPDGSLSGEATLGAGSFFINSKAGAFEDFIMHDVWPFVLQNYSVRPEREAHVLAGVSMGGNGAYHLGMKYRDQFKVVLGVFPPLNTRWLDCHCKYLRNFDPCCWGWRTDFSRKHETIARFYLVIPIHLHRVINELYDIGPDTWKQVSLDNPIEMLDRLDLRDGELDMYVAYGGKDQFNIDAQVESFLYRARQRGLTLTVEYDPHGKHDVPSAMRVLPSAIRWLSERLTPYAPPLCNSP